MSESVVIVGIGEMGGVFARGFLRTGHLVAPVLRTTDPEVTAAKFPDPALALVAVAEADLHPTLDTLPAPWRDRAGLLQNELLPRDWQRHGIHDPTVAVVWFEKKTGTPVTVILPTPVHGPQAPRVADALAAVGVPATVLATADELTFELVAKNLYILVANIAGLETGGSVGELWRDHRDLAIGVGTDVLAIQQALVGRELPVEPLFAHLERAIAADPDHGSTGRSAPARLQRALQHADDHGLDVPALRRIAASAS